MKIEQAIWTPAKGWTCPSEFSLGREAQLIFMFGGFSLVSNPEYFEFVKRTYPKAVVIGCSTAGEIYGTRVYDSSISLTAVAFDSAHIAFRSLSLDDCLNSFEAGKILAGQLSPEGLKHVFVISEGVSINGSLLCKGISSILPMDISATGGLAGDQGLFKASFVYTPEGPAGNALSLLGFYGRELKVGYGHKGGWTPFGLDRHITRSKENILYELDGKPALELYKKYLGEQADGLPATGLLFPLRVNVSGKEPYLVRTILGVNEQDGSMIFAGDMPQGSCVRLMKANMEKLVEGAAKAAEIALKEMGGAEPDLALLISCVGRKLVLKQRAEEEVESVREVLGKNTALTGFYSYGEICPTMPGDICELHNQTMTITTFKEGH
jgi:hypothetical protein